MTSKGYLFFHLNLGFSSIEEEDWPNVITKCYHPLLDLIEKTSIPVGVELTGWTLEQINRIDINWVKRFKELIRNQQCELIGSGYSQIIGPVVPYKVNEWNQKFGLESYKKILDCKPQIVLVNEMAYSNSLVDLYDKFGYKGFIMDRDNIRLAMKLENLSMNEVPSHAKGTQGSILPVLWSDSMLFQKVQHYAHGDMLIDDYLNYVKKRIGGGETIFPIYGNDAEVFDYRPGRFSEERPTHPEGEWQRINNLLVSLSTDLKIEWISPSEALKLNDQTTSPNIASLTSLAHPIPVKKQAKYNIARWAVTGRDDLWLNTMCHRISKYLIQYNNNPEDWRELCELWASDLRTHITQKKWIKVKEKLTAVLNKHNIDSYFGVSQKLFKKNDSLLSVIGSYGDAQISLDRDKIFLNISTANINITLNLRRGMTIHSLAFASHGAKPVIGNLPHGYFSSILLGFDFYTGGVVIELPLERRRITDLERVTPFFSLSKNGDIEICAEIVTELGSINKTIKISASNENISLAYNFENWDNVIGSVRLGNITMLNKFDKDVVILTSNGGGEEDSFILDEEIDHTLPSSTIVSSSSGIGATNGQICLTSMQKNIYIQWDPSECAVMPMMKYVISKPSSLFRIFFSMKELDDTAKESRLGSFSYSISSSSQKQI